jgi:phosphoribulokinase
MTNLLLEENLIQCRKILSDTLAEYNNLLMRIVGVTDSVLKEQLVYDYESISNRLAVQQAILTSAEADYLNSIVSNWYTDYMNFYRKQFVPADLIYCIEKTNKLPIGSLAVAISKQRLRMPTDLNCKRELCMLANTLNKKIKVLGIDGEVIDEIGRGVDTWLLYTDVNITVYPAVLK